MKVCKALILLSLFMVAFYNCAPPPDEDTKEETGEDTTTAELPWTGEPLIPKKEYISMIRKKMPAQPTSHFRLLPSIIPGGSLEYV